MDLNMMMREQARSGLQAQLDTAVTNGDTEAARKAAKDLAALEVSAAPKAPPYGDAEIRAELEKAPWFGTDPRRSAKAIEFGKTMDPKKFSSAEAFAAALIKAVDDDGKPQNTKPTADDADPDVEDDEDAEDDEDDSKPAPKPKPRRTDGPSDSDAGARTSRRASSGPWAKLSDAPADVQKEINRQADKFVSSSAPKEQRETFVKRALESHYAQHQRTKGKR